MINGAHRIITVLLVFILLVGCSNSNNLEKDYVIDYYSATTLYGNLEDFEIDNTTPYEELITKEVDIHTFAQRYEPYGNRTIYDVAENLGIECLRKIDGGAFYSVHRVKQGGLLYVFYNYNIGYEGNINRWFYVRERLSFSDFQNLIKNKDSIDDVIKVNESEQIYLNIYNAHPGDWEKEMLYTMHYLEDGIMDVSYQLVDGKLIFSDMHLTEDFNCPDLDSPRQYPYDAHILDIDWPR